MFSLEDGHTTETCSGYWIKYSKECCVRRKPWTWPIYIHCYKCFLMCYRKKCFMWTCIKANYFSNSLYEKEVGQNSNFCDVFLNTIREYRKILHWGAVVKVNMLSYVFGNPICSSECVVQSSVCVWEWHFHHFWFVGWRDLLDDSLFHKRKNTPWYYYSL
jgi:hypothetical protein